MEILLASFLCVALSLYAFARKYRDVKKSNLRLLKKLEEAQVAKNCFLANISHEIRTPLGAIIGYAELLCSGGIKDRQRDDIVSRMKKNGLLLTQLIDDVLDISKIESGKVTIHPKICNLPSIINEIESVLKIHATKKNLDFSVRNLGVFPEFIQTDELRLKQILMNLLGNAIKFTEKGSVSLIFQYNRNDREGVNYLSFHVEDTGVGIPVHGISEMFQPFNQVEASSVRRYGGAGIGLALSKKLAEMLGGTLSLLWTELGKGSHFRCSIDVGNLENVVWLADLPMDNLRKGFEAPLRSEQKFNQQKEEILEGKNILLVEDSPDNIEIYQLFLRNNGANVDIATDGKKAVVQAFAKSYDLILMDIQIPFLDGKEATRRIRWKGFSGPIVALTAHAMTQEKQDCLNAGCDGQITKPVSEDGLIQQVYGFLNKNENLKMRLNDVRH